jgi:hypothetical protein
LEGFPTTGRGLVFSRECKEYGGRSILAGRDVIRPHKATVYAVAGSEDPYDPWEREGEGRVEGVPS